MRIAIPQNGKLNGVLRKMGLPAPGAVEEPVEENLRADIQKPPAAKLPGTEAEPLPNLHRNLPQP